uniref:Reverse transcriptase domain-containing protein n=1 Tax=Peronospora matthiolae TaxID=2874970 RepID=A0AAV1V710_9STRA
MDVEAEIAARDGGEVFPTILIGPGSTPARQPRLRLRHLSEEEQDIAAAAVQHFADVMASKITDADSWISGEGYILAIPDRLREVLLPFSVSPMGTSSSRDNCPRQRPPRVTRTQREHRLDEALDDMQATQQAVPSDRRAVRKSRRRVGRIRASMAQLELRRRFAQEEANCVSLSSREFRDVLNGFPRTHLGDDCFSEAFSMDEVEDELLRVTKTSSPGHDGVGYDVYNQFAPQLIPLLHAAYRFFWLHRMVPRLWKVGMVRLVHKKGDPLQPTNWRPICLQPAIYKLYSGLLAKRLSCWLELNHRLPMAQKGFREFNGCHEHNFLATTMLDQTRRSRRKLYQVWYDLRNAFGSLP